MPISSAIDAVEKRSEVDSRGDDRYGIVIDSGSSGSRIVVYRWPQPLLDSQDESVLKSPPKVTLRSEWKRKILPGILSFAGEDVGKLWLLHFATLIHFAENIVPPAQQPKTPVFVLATAGMRLLPQSQQKQILKETCKSIRLHSRFLLPDCKEHVQVIDGATEGIYGWLSTNYLLGQFDNYDPAATEHESIGFMDMGGALTQIAFVPSLKEDHQQHHDDLSRVVLRNVNGDTQDWRVFVETWLGFGANEARRRFLNSLVDVLLVSKSRIVNDPCMPRGAETTHMYRDKLYHVRGSGRYDICSKSIYPLLLKNLPCESYPCLFNGVHGPHLNFEKDKFVGISEYWYTANDVFQSGGEYDYHGFNSRVKEFCESDWGEILRNAKEGKYSGLDPDKFLKNACFKANWVLNILHEGFDLPRLGIDVKETHKPDPLVEKTHVPFKSASSINGEELSWTLGKMLMYASSQVVVKDIKNVPAVGITPKENSPIKLGTSYHEYDSGLDDEDTLGRARVWYSVIVLLFLLSMIYRYFGTFIIRWWHKTSRMQVPVRAKSIASEVAARIPGLNRLSQGYIGGDDFYASSFSLEEGLRSPLSPRVFPGTLRPLLELLLRTRSNINLHEQEALVDETATSRPFLPANANAPQSPYQPLNLGPTRFFNNTFQKPFIPKRYGDGQVSPKKH